ncbi:MAG: hypothetical protein WC748_10150 [Legionellales bacterium]
MIKLEIFRNVLKNYADRILQWTSSFWEIVIIIGIVTLCLGWLKEELPSGNWGDVVTAMAFIFAIFIWYVERRYQRSEFYLNQIKEYFKEVKLTLEQQNDRRNINNVKWHKFIECLKVTDKLKTELTIKRHKDIYRADLLTILGYDFINSIEKFANFKVFYGRDLESLPREDYKNTYKLYESTSTDLNNIKRVNPNDLKFLVIFIDDLSVIYGQNKNIIAQDKFDIFQEITLLKYDKPSPAFHTKVLRDYIKDFELNESARFEKNAND